MQKAIEAAGKIRREAAAGKESPPPADPAKAPADKEKPKEPEKKDERTEPAPKAPPEPAKEQAPPAPAPPPPPDPLVEVILGKRQAFLAIRDPASADHFLRVYDKLPERFPFILIARDLEREMVEKLAARKSELRGVILEPSLSTISETSILINTAVYFDRLGVPVAFVPLRDDISGHEELFFALGEMVKAGLKPERALEAVTIAPARFLGIEGRLGSIEAGKDASFCVFRGDPLSGNGRCIKVFRRGEEVYSAGEESPIRKRRRFEEAPP
jgi:hypothetical protein